MKKKILLILSAITIIFLFLGITFIVNINRAKKFLNESDRLRGELHAIIKEEIPKSISEKNDIQLQVNITKGEAKTREIKEFIEKNKSITTNYGEVIGNIDRLNNGFDMMRQGIINKDDDLFNQGFAIVRSSGI